ncbi:SufS family cysteine desulfurase [Candidatus Pacearchaeota archaeon]|nr:SufS family cysteine desulfurase [Candidatus Pacearchaeota archaeon]
MSYKQHFPIFETNKELVYLDSAATTQKPKQVIDAVTKFYEEENANIHRGLYNLSIEATKKYEEARKIVAEFINADENEIIFTSGTTNSINLLVYTIDSLTWTEKEKGKNEIVLSEMEHHSNLVPWQQLAKHFGYKLKFIPLTNNFELDYNKAKEIITDKTAILSITHISNALGTINNVKQLITLAKQKNPNIITIIDAAQSIQHMKTNVKDLDCDFLAFSGHKTYGPMGIGILYGKKPILEKLRPFYFGGDMITSVTLDNSEFQNPPAKFEAGTQNIASVIAMAEAIKFINNIGLSKIQQHEQELKIYALTKLKQIKDIAIYHSPNIENTSSIISFNIKGIHSHDLASLLNDYNIAIRAGHHCCMPLMSALGISGTARISFGIYNTKDDIDKLCNALIKIREVFEK